MSNHSHPMPNLSPIVLDELMRASEARPALMQFRSRIGAHQYRLLHTLAQRYLDPKAPVLDWGAGNGHFSYFLCRAGFDVTCYSLEGFGFRALLDKIPKPRTYTLATGKAPIALPFENGSFGAACSVGVLEHVHESGGTVAGSLAELYRVLRPGGVLLIYHLPNHSSLIEACARRLPGKHAHSRRFTAPELRTRLATAGFDIIDTGRYGFLPRNTTGRLPPALGQSKTLSRAWDGADSILSRTLSPLTQNLFAVARRR